MQEINDRTEFSQRGNDGKLDDYTIFTTRKLVDILDGDIGLEDKVVVFYVLKEARYYKYQELIDNANSRIIKALEDGDIDEETAEELKIMNPVEILMFLKAKIQISMLNPYLLEELGLSKEKLENFEKKDLIEAYMKIRINEILKEQLERGSISHEIAGRIRNYDDPREALINIKLHNLITHKVNRGEISAEKAEELRGYEPRVGLIYLKHNKNT